MKGKMTDLEWRRGTLLFLAFFICIFAILFTRPIRSSLVLEYHSPAMLPRLWFFTGILMFVWVVVFNRLLKVLKPETIFLGSGLFFTLVLGLIQWGFRTVPSVACLVLYVWNDVASIIMVEQIWALLDDYFNEEQAKRAFGPIGTGGIAGGIAGAWFSIRMLDYFPTIKLVSFSVWMMVILLIPCLVLVVTESRAVPDHAERRFDSRRVQLARGFRLIRDSRFLQLLAVSVLLVQITSNVIDLQFNSYVNEFVAKTDDRSRYLAHFLMWMNTFSAFLMIGLPAWLLRKFGLRTGLLILPVVNGVASFASLFGIRQAYPTLKFIDKSFNYSIQRASKEILYIPIRAEDRFQLKPILDVLFYRLSETVAAGLVIPFLKIFSWRYLGWMTTVVCVIQVVVIFQIFKTLRKHLAGTPLP